MFTKTVCALKTSFTHVQMCTNAHLQVHPNIGWAASGWIQLLSFVARIVNMLWCKTLCHVKCCHEGAGLHVMLFGHVMWYVVWLGSLLDYTEQSAVLTRHITHALSWKWQVRLNCTMQSVTWSCHITNALSSVGEVHLNRTVQYCLMMSHNQSIMLNRSGSVRQFGWTFTF